MDLANYPGSRMGPRFKKLEASEVKFFDLAVSLRQRRPEIGPALAKIGKILVGAGRRWRGFDEPLRCDRA